MQRTRHQLFSFSGFAQNDDGQVERRNRLLSCFNNCPMVFEERTILSIIEER